ncbi:MAG: nickel pincer cofactor biosynthesis protein LarC [Bacteroidota bacterium]|jgi:uncharacterized protein (TIGR00299 family) protein
MKIAYFDTVAGVSGDMTLGAFVSAGLSMDVLRAEIQKLNLRGVELEASHVERNGITAVKLDVVISAEEKRRRHLSDVFKIIDESLLSLRVKDGAKKIFMELAKAEAKVHNTSIEKIHFHEVGMLDSIVDIVGASICFEQLGVQGIYSSPVKMGSGGFIDTEHGKLPLPGPAAMEILRHYPVVLTDIPFELTTPTGAAIIKAMSSGVLSAERMRVESVGYGAGTREIPHVPNVLRVLVGELLPAYDDDETLVVETNIDDMNPEIYPYVIDRLLSSGAQDAYLIPVIMKKGRPGILVSALVGRSRLDNVLQVFFAETTTLGVRIQPSERKKLVRSQREVRTQFGMVRAKVVMDEGHERLIPEFEECKRIAVEREIPLVKVYKMLEQEFSVAAESGRS